MPTADLLFTWARNTTKGSTYVVKQQLLTKSFH